MTRKFENDCWEEGGAIHQEYPWESRFYERGGEIENLIRISMGKGWGWGCGLICEVWIGSVRLVGL